MHNDPSDHPLLRAISEMTGLRSISREEKRRYTTQDEVRAFNKSEGRVTEYNDLWAITRAAFRLLEENPHAAVIRADDLIERLQPSVKGDKRRKWVQEASADQVERIVKHLNGSIHEIVIEGDGQFKIRERPDLEDRVNEMFTALLEAHEAEVYRVAAEVRASGPSAVADVHANFAQAVEDGDEDRAQMLGDVIAVLDGPKAH